MAYRLNFPADIFDTYKQLPELVRRDFALALVDAQHYLLARSEPYGQDDGIVRTVAQGRITAVVLLGHRTSMMTVLTIAYADMTNAEAETMKAINTDLHLGSCQRFRMTSSGISHPRSSRTFAEAPPPNPDSPKVLSEGSAGFVVSPAKRVGARERSGRTLQVPGTGTA
ncbi:hypothetical protein ACWEO9_00685 [Streptomyces albidoflavus]